MTKENNTEDALLKIKHLTVEIKDKYKNEIVHAVNDVSLTVYKGKILGIVGESGSGKSVTALTIMGLQSKNSTVVSGDILFQGQNLLCINDKSSIFGKEISIIFQDPNTNLNPLMKVGKQVEENARIHTGFEKNHTREMAKKSMAYAGFTDIDTVYNSYPYQLSGGMKQRAMIASSIILNPSLLIADEPTTALDATIQSQIMDLLLKLKKENKMSMIFISHDFGVISHLSDYVAVMYQGYIMEYGPCREVIRTPAHPYTRGLLKSIPAPYKKGRPLYSIKEDSGFDNEGCPFSKRCEFAERRCFQVLPSYEQKGNRYVRCLRYGELNE